MEELFKHSKLMTSSKNYNQWICILYPVPSCSIHCPHHIPSAWNGEGCFHQGHGTVDPMEFRSTPLLEDRQEATSFRSFWMPKLGASQKSRELRKWMLFLRLRCFEHVYERQRIYTKLHPTIKAALQSEMTKCISGMQTSAHDSTVDPLNFHGHSAAQAISHAFGASADSSLCETSIQAATSNPFYGWLLQGKNTLASSASGGSDLTREDQTWHNWKCWEWCTDACCQTGRLEFEYDCLEWQ